MRLSRPATDTVADSTLWCMLWCSPPRRNEAPPAARERDGGRARLSPPAARHGMQLPREYAHTDVRASPHTHTLPLWQAASRSGGSGDQRDQRDQRQVRPSLSLCESNALSRVLTRVLTTVAAHPHRRRGRTRVGSLHGTNPMVHPSIMRRQQQQRRTTMAPPRSRARCCARHRGISGLVVELREHCVCFRLLCGCLEALLRSSVRGAG